GRRAGRHGRRGAVSGHRRPARDAERSERAGEMRRLGRSAVAVGPLGFGGGPIGNLFSAVDDADALGAVRAAWDGGVRYFDTAPHYGLGLSERRLGQVLRDRPRGSYTLSTKVGRLLAPTPGAPG